MAHNTKAENVLGKKVILSERFVLDVQANEHPGQADDIKLLYWASQVVSDSIKAGYYGKFFGHIRALFFSTKKIFRKSSPGEIERLFKIVYFELELNEQSGGKSKKKVEA